VEPHQRTVRAPDGRNRTYYVLDPLSSRAAGGPEVPLVVAIHGGGESALRFHVASGFSRLAETHGFVLAYPEGVGEHDESEPGRVRRRGWNAGRCCGAARREGVDDVGFVSAMVDRLCEGLPIDQHRRYAVGHSNGGMLAFRLALERPGLFAGIGVQSASIAVDTPGPTVATHLIAVHGGSDRHHPIDGGRGPESSVESPYGSVREACERFRAVDGARVELVEVAEGTHSWMGPDSAAAAGRAEAGGRHIAGGPPFAGFDTAAAIWGFLSEASGTGPA
jgi:polyhydroxybutyrate depolymerase